MAAMGRAVEAEDEELAALRRPLGRCGTSAASSICRLRGSHPSCAPFSWTPAPRRLVISRVVTSCTRCRGRRWSTSSGRSRSHRPVESRLRRVRPSGRSDGSSAHGSQNVGPWHRAPDRACRRRSIDQGVGTTSAFDRVCNGGTGAGNRSRGSARRSVERHHRSRIGGFSRQADRGASRSAVELRVESDAAMGRIARHEAAPTTEPAGPGIHDRDPAGLRGPDCVRFYGTVFDGKPPLDPETAIVEERSRLYADRLRACEWASMTIWLRGVVDLGAAVLDGPRLPPTAWSVAAVPADWDVVRNRLQRFAETGSILVMPRTAASGAAPCDVAADYRGVVLHVRQGTLDADLAVEPLGSSRDTRQPAHRQSADRGHRRPRRVPALARAVDRRRPAIGRGRSLADPRAAVADDCADLPEPPRRSSGSDRGRCRRQSGRSSGDGQRGRFSRARRARGGRRVLARRSDVGLRDVRRADMGGRQIAANARGWLLVVHPPARRRQGGGVPVCARPFSPSEAALLRGNLAARRGEIDEAKRLLGEARRLAAGNASDEGRALLELANLARKRSDAGAEPLFRDALAHLEQGSATDDRRWRSALGRVLRDYADLLCGDDRRLAEADALLQRALINHALDNRMSQVATGLQPGASSRGRAATSGRPKTRSDPPRFYRLDSATTAGGIGRWKT